MKSWLRAPISMTELDEALKGMPTGKAPGHEGVLTEFYNQYWSLIKEIILPWFMRLRGQTSSHPASHRG
jgi:hypothetical protein